MLHPSMPPLPPGEDEPFLASPLAPSFISKMGVLVVMALVFVIWRLLGRV